MILLIETKEEDNETCIKQMMWRRCGREKERDGGEEGEKKAEMGQNASLLYFPTAKASLKSQFPERAGICLGVRVRTCTGACMRSRLTGWL